MKLKLTKEQHEEIMEYVRQCPDEIGGLGTIVFDEQTGDAHVEKLFMIKQKVHGATCELDPEDIGRVMAEAFVQECKGELIFWWHSHVNMGVTPSSQDDATMAQIGSAGTCVAMIINKKGETSCRYFQKKPKLVVNIPVEVMVPINTELSERVAASIAANVSKLTYGTYSAGGGRAYGCSYDDDDYFHNRRALHEKTTETTKNTEGNKEKEKGVTVIKGEAALREFFYNDFITKAAADKSFANDVFKDFARVKHTNAIDMEELIEFYVERKLNQKF